MELHIILNDHAGNGRASKKYAELQRALKTSYTLHRTSHPKHATELVSALAKKHTHCLCVILGGDGTIHEAIQSAIYGDIVIGAMNAGSGNDFGRGFPIFQNAAEIDAYVENPLVERRDAGLVKGEDFHTYFMNNAGFGIDAEITNRVNHSKLKKQLNRFGLGKLAYVFIMIDELLHFQPFRLQIERDGKRQQFDRVWVAAFSNQPYIGGGMKLAPFANTADGKIELTIVHGVSRWMLLFVFGTIFPGKHIAFKRFVKQQSVQSIEITLDTPTIGHADGEFIGKRQGNIQAETIASSWQVAQKKLD
ncbi:diacylglycerol/lipid kinase family protein [Kurthia senegalensis]|uniref:diacylglycerol/lipid kinase family protein n=1 Tax=Kurthia senegalensis TaxID=1033740 RepID=UPI00028A163E|nr:YegS/Rv2252/BmrU family lipid kinase [Kurthia senegalensis]